MLRILGIDPGSAVTGYGAIERRGSALRHLGHGTLRPPRGETLAARLQRLHAGVREVVARHAPDVVCVEQVFVAASPRSALVLGQARGAVLAALGEAGLTLVEFAPSRIKQAVTGSGRAAKSQVQYMVRRLLALERSPAADAADALAAAICGAHLGPLEPPRPAPRRLRRGRAPSFAVRRST